MNAVPGIGFVDAISIDATDRGVAAEVDAVDLDSEIRSLDDRLLVERDVVSDSSIRR